MKNEFGIVRVRYIDEEERYEYSLMPYTYRDMKSAETNAAYLGDEIGDMLIPTDIAYVSDVSKKQANIWIAISKNESKMVKSLFSVSAALDAEIDFMSWIDFWENGEADDMIEVAHYAGVDRPALAKAAYHTADDYLSFDGVDSSIIDAAISAVSGKSNSRDVFSVFKILKDGNFLGLANHTRASILIIEKILKFICYLEDTLPDAIVLASYLTDEDMYPGTSKSREALGRKLSAILPLREVLLASVK